MAAKIRKGDTVVVITGKDKGVQGEVIQVLPKEDRVIVEGVNVAKKHQRSTGTTKQAGIIDKNMPIHISNVMLVHKGKPTRVGFRVEADGTKVRIAKRTGEVIS
jgi:large subunit ribosomal protein L24